MPNKIVALSIDIDGCLLLPDQVDTWTTLKRRVNNLITYINGVIQNKHNDTTELHLFLGSARQTAFLDHYNNNLPTPNNQNRFDKPPRCFDIMLALRKLFDEKLDKPVHLQKLLIGDVMDNKSAGWYFNYYLRRRPTKHIDSISIDYYDPSKTQLIHTQMQYLASQQSDNDEIQFFFIDDRADILEQNRAYFQSNQQLIPSNTHLGYIQFNENLNFPQSFALTNTNYDVPTIHGTNRTPNDCYQQLIKLCDKQIGRLSFNSKRETHQILIYKIKQIKQLATEFYNETPASINQDKIRQMDILVNDQSIPGQPDPLAKFFCCSQRSDLALMLQDFQRNYITRQHSTVLNKNELKQPLQDNNSSFSIN